MEDPGAVCRKTVANFIAMHDITDVEICVKTVDIQRESSITTEPDGRVTMIVHGRLRNVYEKERP